MLRNSTTLMYVAVRSSIGPQDRSDLFRSQNCNQGNGSVLCSGDKLQRIDNVYSTLPRSVSTTGYSWPGYGDTNFRVRLTDSIFRRSYGDPAALAQWRQVSDENQLAVFTVKDNNTVTVVTINTATGIYNQTHLFELADKQQLHIEDVVISPNLHVFWVPNGGLYRLHKI